MYININIYIYIYFNIYIQDDIHDIINLWHGKLQFNLSPNVFLKQKVIAYSLKEDFKVGNNSSCGFVDVYLINSFFDIKSHHLVDSFKQFSLFSSAEARSLMIKVLLYPRAFKVNCNFCKGIFINTFEHYVFNCDYLKNQSKHLRNISILYGFLKDYLFNKRLFLTTCLEKRLWTKCFTKFLKDTKY